MRAGTLDRQLTLLRASPSTDAMNETVIAWLPLATVRAKRLDLSDTQKVQAAQAGIVMSVRYEIRWSQLWADLSPLDRLEEAGRQFDIVGAKEIQRRRGFEITAVARPDQPTA